MPVLKTQTCNWNHSNSFHELFRRHTTHLARPRQPQRSFFFLCSQNPTAAFALLCLDWVKIYRFNKTYVPINILPQVKGIKDWWACVDEKIRSFISRRSTDVCWAPSPVARSYQVAKHSAFELQRLTTVIIGQPKSKISTLCYVAMAT